MREEGVNSIIMSDQTADPMRNSSAFWEIYLFAELDENKLLSNVSVIYKVTS